MSRTRRALIVAACWLCGWAAASDGLADRGANNNPGASSPAATTQPDSETSTAPTGPADQADQPAKILFQFDGVPYTEVVRRFAQHADKPLIGDLNIEGTLTFFDSEPYTYQQALDTLNIILGMRGYALREEGRFLRLRPLQEVAANSRILKGLDEAVGVRPTEIVTVMIPLKFLDPNAASKAVVRLVSGFGSVAPLGQGKGLVITDRLENIRRVRELLQTLDVGELVERQLRNYVLKNASAKTAAGILQNLFGVKSARKWTYDAKHNRLVPQPPDPQDVVTVSYDDRANMVVLVGTGENLAMAEQMLQKLDQAEGITSGDIRIFELKKARADTLAGTLDRLLPSLETKGTEQRPSIVPDMNANRLIVSATPEQMKRLADVITELDSASVATSSVRIFDLKYANANAMVWPVLRATAVRDARGRETHTLSVAAEGNTNRLIVSGPQQEIETAATIIQQLDTKPIEQTREIHVVQLETADARQVARALQNMFRDQIGQAASKIDIEAEPNTNSVVIACTPEEWPQAKTVLDELEKTAVKTSAPTTRIVPLKHAQAEDLARVLSQNVRSRHWGRRGRRVPINITPNPQANSLLITAAPADQDELDSLIRMLDTPPEVEPVTVIELKSVNAQELVRRLTDMLPEARGWRADVQIQAVPQTNSVLLRASEEKRQMIEQIIANLDEATRQHIRQTRLLKLEHVSAGAMANLLQQLYPARRDESPQQQASFTPGPHGQTLIVEAPRDQMDAIAQMAEQLDRKGGTAAFEVRTYEITNGNAAEIASSLSRLFAQQYSRQLRSVTTADPQPRFEVNRATNQLMVAATPAQFTVIDNLIAELQNKSRLATQTRTFQLAHAKPQAIARMLQTMLASRRRGQEPVRVAAMEEAGRVVVQGTPEQVAMAEQLITTFDSAEAAPQAVIRVVELANAQADTLSRSVRQTLREQDSPVSLSPEPNSNSVLLSGPADKVDDVIAMIRQLDADSVREDVEVRVYPLKNSQASQLADSIRRMFRDILQQQLRSRQGGKPSPFAVSADDRTNSLVVSTTPANFATVEQMLKQLDSKDQTGRDVQYVFLENAEAIEVANQLDDMFRERRWQERPVIQADLESNTLTLIASDQDLTLMMKVVDKIDQAAAHSTMRVRVVPLQGVPAEKMAAMLKRIYGQMSDADITVTDRISDAPTTQPLPNPAVVEPDVSANDTPDSEVAFVGQRSDGRGNAAPPQAPAADKPATQPAETPLTVTDKPAPKAQQPPPRPDEPKLFEGPRRPSITIAVDTKANALLLSGPKRDLEQIETLIADLTYGSVAAEAEFRTFPLQHADPAEIAQTLDDLFNPKTPQRVGNRLYPPEPVITVVPEPRTRSVIVRAKPMEFEAIEPMIRRLDTVTEQVNELRIFTLKNTQAAPVAQTLAKLFEQAATQTPRRGRGTPQDRRQQMVNQLLTITTPDGRKQVDTSVSVTIDANEQANSLVVAAPASAMELIARLISELDQSAAAVGQPVVRMYPLQQAEVAATVTALQQLFPQPRARRNRNEQLPVLVTGDETARVVIVSTSDEKQKLVAKVINDLDQARDEAERIVKIYTLENAEAGPVADALQKTLSQSAGRRDASPSAVRISPEPSNNSLVISASTKEHDRIEKLIARLDASRLSRQPVQIIPLRRADPEKLAATLTRLFEQQRRRRGQSGPSPILIEADPAARSLMVRADEENFKTIAELARQLDATSTAGVARQTVIPLEYAQASSVAAALQQAFRPPRGQRVSLEELVTVVAENDSNSLIVTANETNLEKVQALVDRLDDEETGGMKSEFILLRHADADELAGVLSRIATGTSRSRGRRGEQSVTIAAESAANAIVMSGPALELSRLMQMAEQLDQAADASQTGVYIIPLTNGDAGEVVAMIRDLYNQMVQASRQAKQPVEPLAVSADQRANAVVIATSKGMHQQVERWIQQVEQMKPARGQLHIVPLKEANPDDVKRAIEQLFDTGASGKSGRSSGGKAVGRVEVTVLPAEQSLMISANEENLKTVMDLVARLEAAAEKSRRKTRIYTLQHAPTARVVQALQEVYRQRGRIPEDQRISISSMDNSNAILVAAPEEKLTEIEHLVQQLDRKEIAPQLVFRIFPLQNARPEKILPVLRPMLRQVQQMHPDESIDIQADERTRSLIVTAREDLFTQIKTLIETLDRAPAYETADVRIVPLKRADATQLAKILNDMLRPDGNQITAEARTLQEQVRLLRVTNSLEETVPQLDLTKPIKITADPARPQGSNALIISSTPDNIAALVEVARMLDTVPLAPGVAMKVVHLDNADAPSVQRILEEVFRKGDQLAGKPGTTVAGRAEPENTAGQALVRELNVASDTRTNSLILAGQEEVIALAEVLAKDLDRQKGQVITEVRLFRLKHADADRLAPILQSVFAEGNATPATAGVNTQVSRLKTYLRKQRPNRPENADPLSHTSEYPKPHQALSIRADSSTNLLVVAARSDIMPLIADLIESMDLPGAGSLNTVRIFPLENADATRMKQVIASLYTGPNAKLVRDEDKPTISVDPRTNALIVSASENTFSMLTTLLGQLDKQTPPQLRDLRLLKLEHADAASLAPTIQKMMDARVQRQASLGVKDAASLQVIVSADPRSNSLIIGGSPESFGIIRDLAGQLDTASPALSGKVQLIPLAEGNASAVAQTLQRLFDRRYQAAKTADIQRQRPVILPDVRTNSLLIAAGADDSSIITGLLEKLDVKLTDPSVKLVVIPLEHNDAGAVGPTIQKLFSARLASMTPPGQQPNPQDRVDVVTDPLSNALIVSASKENLSLIRDLLAKVDVAPPDETGIVRMYPLKHADAARVATMLENLLKQGLYKPGLVASGDNKAVQAREKVALTVDPRTNVLIVSASRENFAIIEQIIDRVDSSGDFGLLGDVRVFMLTYADATNLAPMLQKFFTQKRRAEEQTGSTGRSMPVVIIPDSRTNALLVAGGRESFAAVENMIQKLDADTSAPATLFEIFSLQRATASVLQSTLQRLFDQRATRGESREKVTIIADNRDNTLIVGAPPSEMEMVRNLIQRLDEQARDKSKVVKVFPLNKGDAAETAETLRSLYRSQGGNDSDINISVDERTNALLVSAGQADLERLEGIIQQLDREKVTRVTEIKVFTLENADAEELSEILTDVLTNKPKALTKVSPNRQTLLQFIGRTEQGKQLITSALKEGLLITPDKRTNSLVVSAPLENMPLLANLIESLDSTSPKSAEIKVFTLNNADALQMATVLEQLFRVQQPVGPNRKNPAVKYTFAASQPANASPAAAKQPAATTGDADQYALSITVDTRTNSLLIGGTKYQVEMASAVIRELDSSPARERLTRVYRPRYGQPDDIETALREFLDQERQRLQQVLGNDRIGAAQRLLEREVSVVSEPNSNTLLISASPRYFTTLERMIEQLDQPPAQVLIQALLAEVRLDNQADLGFEWNWRVRDNNKTFNVGPRLNVEAGIPANGIPGFNVSLTGGDLTFFLRALESQNRLEVLSRPQIVAVDNVESRINVGQRVPLITSSRVTDQGDTINTVEYQDVGVSLDILPRIGSDGTIRLQVRPEISSVSQSFTLLSEFARANYINNRSAQTTVNCHDGQTIIIGGLISTTDEDREDRVPILGDLPLVGLLFRSTSKIKNRNELLVFLTPTVMRNRQNAFEVSLDALEENRTLKTLKRNDDLKDQIIKSLKPDALQQEVMRGSNDLPTSAGQRRMQNIQRSVLDLELLPEQWEGTPFDIHRSDPDTLHRAMEKEVE